MARIQITYDDQPAQTLAQAAAEHGLAMDAMRKALQRAGVEPLPEPLDARTPLYDQVAVKAVMATRPGKGANLRRSTT